MSIAEATDQLRILSAQAKFDGVLIGALSTLHSLGDQDISDEVDWWRLNFIARLEEQQSV